MTKTQKIGRLRISNRRKRQALGMAIGVAVGMPVVLHLVSDDGRDHVAHGPLNTGHEQLDCSNCHIDAPGTLRQQLQANARYLLGLRQSPVTIGTKPVNDQSCLECHERPNDRHPTFRFLEPRFAEARHAIAPHKCASCHLEHSGVRVTREPGFCQNCHRELALDRPVIEPTHAQLVARDEWDSCLGCHDYHGNHVMVTPDDSESQLPASAILEYFNGAASPYSESKYHPAQQPSALNEHIN